MADKYEEKQRFDGKKVKILLPQYGPSPDEEDYQWRKNITAVNLADGADPVHKYLETAERYFYSEDWFGSEKRKNPA
ncbi:MAG: hypothetical protein AB1473_06120 [Thermodesulfobacteriota bacterium]